MCAFWWRGGRFVTFCTVAREARIAHSARAARRVWQQAVPRAGMVTAPLILFTRK